MSDLLDDLDLRAIDPGYVPPDYDAPPQVEAVNPVEAVKGVYYIATTKGVGTYFIQRPNGTFLPTKSSDLKKHLMRKGFKVKPPEGESLSEVDHIMLDLQMDHALDYAGNVAGFDAGEHKVGGVRFLSLRSPVTPTPKPGPYDTLQAVFDALFPDDDNRLRFMAWLYHAWKALHNRQWSPMPVVGLAGQRNCGKTLLVDLTANVLGGTAPGKAYRFISGETAFNADLCGAHLLTVDDVVSSTDMRTRRATGQIIKGLAVTNSHRIEAKGYDACTLTPHWRAMIACNDDAESLQVLPPIDDGMRDKLLLLRCVKGSLPMPGVTAQERAAFMAKLMQDVPGFLADMAFSDWKDGYGDTRQIVTGWQDPVLADSLRSLDSEEQLLDLIDTLKPWDGDSHWRGTAADLESALTDYKAPTCRKAQQLLSSWSKACGVFLGRLADSHPERVQRGEVIRRYEWIIKAP